MEKINTTLFLDNSITSKFLLKEILCYKCFKVNCVILSDKKIKNFFKKKVDKIFISNLKKKNLPILNFLEKKNNL